MTNFHVNIDTNADVLSVSPLCVFIPGVKELYTIGGKLVKKAYG